MSKKLLDLLACVKQETREMGTALKIARRKFRLLNNLVFQLETEINTPMLCLLKQAKPKEVLKNYGTHCDPLYLANDLGQILEMKKIRNSIAKFKKCEKVKKSVKIILVNRGTVYEKTQKSNLLTPKGVRRVICNSRRDAPEKLLQQFGLNQYDDHFVPIETSIICRIEKIFPDQKFLKQFPCGNYRLDLYEKTKNIAIEIDENGHNHYNKITEAARTEKINAELAPTWVRFDTNRPETFDDTFGELFRALNN